MPLAIVTSQHFEYEWATTTEDMALTLAPVAGLGMLTLMAVVVALLLSRTQAIRDMSTMYAVGASPGFLRRFGLTQTMTILVPGVPLGIGAGIALGRYHIAWNRHIGSGAWLDIVPCWVLQIALAVAVVAAGLLAAWLVTRPPPFYDATYH